jgi:aminoglycoside phosphotransferase
MQTVDRLEQRADLLAADRVHAQVAPEQPAPEPRRRNARLARVLRRLHTLDDHVEPLPRILQDRARQRIRNVGTRMADSLNPRAIPRVMEVARSYASLGASIQATDVLAKLGDPRAIPQFVSLVADTDRHLADG